MIGNSLPTGKTSSYDILCEIGQPIGFYFTLSRTTTPSSDSTIEAGMNNTIIVPSQIFTNSWFYKNEIEGGNGAINWPNLTFYGDDASASSTTAHVSGIITGNTTGDEFLELLEELSKNTTGEIAYNYTFDDPTYMNLPGDVLKLVPFSGYAIHYNTNAIVLIENSPTEDLAVSSKWSYNTVNFDIGSIIGGIINFAIEVGTVVWDFVKTVSDIVCSAITAIVTTFTEFLNQLGKALINFGKALVGAFEDAIAVVAEVVKKVVEVMGAIIQWIIDMMKETINAIFSPLIDAINTWSSHINKTISGSYEYYSIHRGLGPWSESLSHLFNVELFIPISAMWIGLVAATYAISGFTLGLGTLVFGAISGLIVQFLMTAILEKVIQGNTISGLPSDMAVPLIVNFVKSIYCQNSRNNHAVIETTRGSRGENFNSDIFWGYLSAALGLISSAFTMAAIVKGDSTGTTAVVGAGIFGVQALLVGSLALALSYDFTASMVVGGVAAALGAISLIFGLFMKKIDNPILKTLNWASQILGWSAIGIYSLVVMGVI